MTLICKNAGANENFTQSHMTFKVLPQILDKWCMCYTQKHGSYMLCMFYLLWVSPKPHDHWTQLFIFYTQRIHFFHFYLYVKYADKLLKSLLKNKT